MLQAFNISATEGKTELGAEKAAHNGSLECSIYMFDYRANAIKLQYICTILRSAFLSYFFTKKLVKTEELVKVQNPSTEQTKIQILKYLKDRQDFGSINFESQSSLHQIL